MWFIAINTTKAELDGNMELVLVFIVFYGSFRLFLAYPMGFAALQSFFLPDTSLITRLHWTMKDLEFRRKPQLVQSFFSEITIWFDFHGLWSSTRIEQFQLESTQAFREPWIRLIFFNESICIRNYGIREWETNIRLICHKHVRFEMNWKLRRASTCTMTLIAMASKYIVEISYQHWIINQPGIPAFRILNWIVFLMIPNSIKTFQSKCYRVGDSWVDSKNKNDISDWNWMAASRAKTMIIKDLSK